MQLQSGEIVRIESYKHGKKIHRIWKESVILKHGEPLILANYNAQVVERDGKEWIFPGLSIVHFSSQQWFHTVLLYDEQFRLKNYYCNIASPYQFVDGRPKTLTYIDYDLDLIVEPDLGYRWVDEDEFRENSVRYRYPAGVIEQVKLARRQLVEAIHQREEPFTRDFAQTWYHQYLSLKTEYR
ncbi:DUF402 domain-containing protein [Lihuaxuella thermophila]|uniref:DUF402 domain-containing protein n=1 Tax=Lihuaxuella thermophila TaxID=1173111 RepID=A0A1H8IY87_9BACL|nr:DUF402 domain-containing protein [Lihuaxuella thermophila]SEN73309.1 hypothetical protein SAMN05444955_12017 [Lihuaxuella thermophila]